MTKINYITHDNQTHSIDVQNGLTVMEGAVQNDIPGIDADCGGGCLAWLADGYCDDGTWGIVFWTAGNGCPEWGNDCGDCDAIDDPYGVWLSSKR